MHLRSSFSLTVGRSKGPRLTLEVEVIYEQFLASGTPSGIGFEGGFVVDDTDEYAVAFNIGTNPKESLVKLKAACLESGQVINLINAAADLEIENPKHEMIRFQDVNVYASPLGCIIGTQAYPPGFAVQGKAFIFGNKVEIDARIGSEGMKLKGEIDGFELGPLAVRGGKRADGTRGEKALIDFEITKERQCFEVSGSVILFDLEASVFVKAQVMPEPDLEFNFELSWSDLLRFQVDGKLIKSASEGKEVEAGGGVLSKLKDADFQVHALMEQRILSEISEAMRKWFASAQASVHEGIDAAKRKVDEAKAEFERKCEVAKQEVQKTRIKFDAAMERAQGSLREKEENCRQERLANERYIVEEEKRADEKIRVAVADLDAKKKAFEEDTEEKKRNLNQKRRDGDEAINSKIRELQGVRETLQRKFGNAIQALESAKARVWAEQGEYLHSLRCWYSLPNLTCSPARVDRAQRDVDEAVDELDDAAWYEKPFLVSPIDSRIELPVPTSSSLTDLFAGMPRCGAESRVFHHQGSARRSFAHPRRRTVHRRRCRVQYRPRSRQPC
ncbi:hypothetical protein B0T26DRAFT_646791 [Lasiosphaeria miniovina]|uniref:Uncharacterized protein n=1 Tax=Lasiosphaeria miniovina TaxID=1954250 RepID=A0AA40AKC9_9PEZI|nr:uncharacterized protein B0T26DRAFT_646791 [Lasiosphaeria miniovina]KAK0717458.1 hypothetical protein B0T26DRAFT_646791 [Lasiosphaeria miniovina]